MYKSNQLWNRYFPRSQRISYRYRETPRCLSIYIIDLNQFLLLFLLTITKQKYFSSSSKFFFFYYIVFEFIPLLVVRPWYSENYIATISCTWEWASMYVYVSANTFSLTNDRRDATLNLFHAIISLYSLVRYCYWSY